MLQLSSSIAVTTLPKQDAGLGVTDKDRPVGRKLDQASRGAKRSSWSPLIWP
ncbi:hypothetical protein IVB34_47935 [Bradyrhizobium sp. 2]|nr:hypothetical protein [Bradyrhizobium sp. 2]MCK1465813.1 hypothetical protein [Bradyrhizobium sp. 2]